MGSGHIAPPFLTYALGAHAPAILCLGKEVPVPIGLEAGWAPQPVWMLKSREEFYPLPGIEP
jgi:hypothetical protein